MIITFILILLTIVSYELWFHKDRLGRSYLDMHLGGTADWRDQAVCLLLGTIHIHRLVQDWLQGKRAAPWDNDFNWSEMEEFN